MSDKKHRNAPFTNEDTIVRRVWIETALESVRGRLGSLYPDPDPATAGTGIDGAINQDVIEHGATDEQARHASGNGRPRLYVAWSSPQRRSGT